jgi:DNA processing protein
MDLVDMQLALGRAPGLTVQHVSAVLAAVVGDSCPKPTDLGALFAHARHALCDVVLPPAAHRALRLPDWARIAHDRRWMESERVELIDALSARYPSRLAHIPDAPALLYLKGMAACLQAPQLAIVGSRHPTEAGRRTAREFAAHLSKAGLTITSGLAYGIDAASHEGALASAGQTIAVLGTGLDQVYPSAHRELALQIAAHGALLSELPPGSPPLKFNFPRRNRLISGLSLGLLVVEAARASGSLITARLAGDQGREVFAIPGSIHNPLARGCHALIRAGAKLVEEAGDILEEIKISPTEQLLMHLQAPHRQPTVGGRALDKGYKILLDAIGFESASLDELVNRTGLTSQSVASMLLMLELEGAVGIQAGGQYVRL